MSKNNFTQNEWWMNRGIRGVVITDNLRSTHFGGGKLLSLVCEDKDIENGHFGFIGTKVEGERDLSEFITPDSFNITRQRPVLVASPVVLYAGFTPEMFQEHHFINYAGKPMRCYELFENDEFSITEYTVDTLEPFDPETGTGGATAGNCVVLQAGSNRLREVTVASLTGSEVFVADIIDIDSSPTRPYIMIHGKRPARMLGFRVVRNSV